MNILLSNVGMLFTISLLTGCGTANATQPVDIQTTSISQPSVSSISAYTTNTVIPEGAITEEEAKQIALTHAGIAETSANFVKCKFDYDDGVAEYEVEFYVDNTEYDYEINATTGVIIGYDYDMETQRIDISSKNNKNTIPEDAITEEEAKQIALTHAGIAETSVSFIKCEFDYDNGVAEYEVEFYIGRTEYEYEINAITGVIIGYDYDND